MTNPLDIFRKEAPAVAGAFDNLIQSIVAGEGLDEKTKQLIYIALKAADGDTAALSFHVPMAKQLGATRQEVSGAIILTLTVCGLKGVTSCLPAAMAVFDQR
jgi:alkylhydroperoxidase/carboxymuconolactone decarboxylase family protein YurZ